ncbi:hypothetical protein BFL35_14255 [Clavibacter michiganensis]|nr:hypothetical protein BFL35_14255 [Clavibacter michiganensis]
MPATSASISSAKRARHTGTRVRRTASLIPSTSTTTSYAATSWSPTQARAEETFIVSSPMKVTAHGRSVRAVTARPRCPVSASSWVTTPQPCAGPLPMRRTASGSSPSAGRDAESAGFGAPAESPIARA